MEECNGSDCSSGIGSTFEAGVATYHVRASGQSHLQQLLPTSITLLAPRGLGVALSVLQVDPTIGFICRKVDRVDKDVISSHLSWARRRQAQGPYNLDWEEPFPAVASNLGLMN